MSFQSTIPPPVLPPLDPATSRILIVGAGVFGLSTAYHLQEDGFKDITILDKADELPALDAASTDINKVVRSIYADSFYTRLARDAIARWKEPMWEGCYHESSVLLIGRALTDKSYENDFAEGARVTLLPNAEKIRSAFPDSLHRIPEHERPLQHRLLGDFSNYTGYINLDGGWVEATRSVKILLGIVIARGAKVESGKEVLTLLNSNADGSGYTCGAMCVDGSMYCADQVILAAGSWTASSFPGLELDQRCLASGQSLAFLQLTPEESERYRKSPVVMDFRTGFYVLPPNKDNVIKTGLHAAGHTHMVTPSAFRFSFANATLVPRKISTPRTVLSHPEGSDGLRDCLRVVYPDLAEKPWAGTRMCWYTDSPDSDWVIGQFPGDPGLFLATSGSGHGFKFLPNVGRIVVDILRGRADATTEAKFAVDRGLSEALNTERVDKYPEELVPEELCGPEDMLP
ncbi:FAD dependent oxidoreductase [Pisolithus orientalis]|uniref:FAD dependent oxidoreductase n=1 Tax=Pisolithus orientalis TaxID=936130 RepID=UPI0022253490|nr:FAD dependent oxidoreductase [Pisolithus orientalis]KAI6007717.1 FAD dependent oxidoreductase [Pisolithus orientalis]